MKIPALLTILAISCGAAFAQGTEPTPSPQQSATTSDQGIARGNRVDGTAAKTRSSGTTMGNSSANTGAMAKDAPMASDTTTASSDTMTHKAKRGAHKAKHSAKKAAHKARVAMHNDTRSMGASGSDMGNGSRQQRMDAAYDSWKSKQK
ncbi:MAG: hypothetical protein V4787_01245 [Pseudomonadota bacterium]